jgi:hypothetical protein
MEFWGWHFRQLCRHSKPRHFCFSDWRDSNHLLKRGAYTHSVFNWERYCPQHPPAFSRRAEDHQDMIPQHFNKLDGVAVGTAFLSFFKIIPWPEIAAFLAAVYTLCRLIGMVVRWWRGK